MIARSDELQKSVFLHGWAAFFVSGILCLEPARRKFLAWLRSSLPCHALMTPTLVM